MSRFENANLGRLDTSALSEVRLSPPTGVTQLGDPSPDIAKQALVLAHCSDLQDRRPGKTRVLIMVFGADMKRAFIQRGDCDF